MHIVTRDDFYSVVDHINEKYITFLDTVRPGSKQVQVLLHVHMLLAVSMQAPASNILEHIRHSKPSFVRAGSGCRRLRSDELPSPTVSVVIQAE